MSVLRILIADDHDAVRRGLRSLIESHARWRVCGEARNGREAVEEIRRLKPDVALLDMTMSGLNGLAATREIARERPATSVLLLTTHQSPELNEEVRRAGARGIVSKSDPDALFAAIESLYGDGHTVHLAGAEVGGARHIAALFSSTEERYNVVGPFTSEGLSKGEKSVHIIEPPGRDVHIRRLKEAGVDFDRAEADDLIELIAWDEIYLHGGHFDQYEMLERLHELIRRCSKEDRIVRVVANMEWALEEQPGVGDLVEYEARVSQVVTASDDVIICAYDTRKFPSDIVLKVLRAHPAAIIGGELRDNSFYVAPEQVLRELGPRA